MMAIDVIQIFIKYYLGWGGVGHVGVGWSGSCRGGMGWVMHGWGGSFRGGVGWVM